MYPRRDWLGVKRVRDGRRAITLCYNDLPLERLLADVAITARGLPAGVVLRVYTNHSEAQARIPTWCAAQGYTLLLVSDDEAREGDQHPFGDYRFDIERTPTQPT